MPILIFKTTILKIYIFEYLNKKWYNKVTKARLNNFELVKKFFKGELVYEIFN